MKNYTNKQEFFEDMIIAWNIPAPTDFELKNWKCKKPLKASLSFLVGKEIMDGDKKGIVREILWDYRGPIIIDTNNLKYRLCVSKIKMMNPFFKKIEEVKIWTQKGFSILSDKFYINQKDFKSIYYKTDEYRKKFNTTMIERYETTVPLLNPILKEKSKKTMNERHGVDWFLQRGEHYKVIDDVMIETYGAKTPMQAPILKEKIKNTMNERHGVDYFLQRGEHYNKIENIMIDLYGNTNYFLTDSFLKTKEYKSYSKKEIQFIEEITNKFNIIDFNSNVNNKPFMFNDLKNNRKYYLDFYYKELNLVIEFYGDYWHCNPEIYADDFFNIKMQKTAKEIREKDINRKRIIKKTLDCTFVEVWENDWNIRKESTMNYLEYLINDLRKKLESK